MHIVIKMGGQSAIYSLILSINYLMGIEIKILDWWYSISTENYNFGPSLDLALLRSELFDEHNSKLILSAFPLQLFHYLQDWLIVN